MKPSFYDSYKRRFRGVSIETVALTFRSFRGANKPAIYYVFNTGLVASSPNFPDNRIALK